MNVHESWFEEKQSAWLYRQVADVETDGRRRALFVALAQAADSQAAIWSRKLAAAGHGAPTFRAPRRARVVAWLLHRVGVRPMLPVLAAMKVRGLSVYKGPLGPSSHAMPTSVDDVGGRHRRAGGSGTLRAAVFGVNDGLVSNTSLIMGIAGASHDAVFIVTAGAAGLLAGALSMAAGEYVSMRSQRDMYESQIALEREELAEYPDEETEELALIYNARGMDMDEARHVARDMLRDPAHALDVLAREELGLDPDDLGAPWGAAGFSFAAFSLGALVPLAPFMFGMDEAGVPAAAVLAALSLFAVGAVLSLYSGRSAFWGGARMVLIGGGAGALAYGIGAALGVGLG